jgi:uncharacterized membrane protein
MLSLSLIFVIIILLFTFLEIILPDHGQRNHLFSVTISPDARQLPEVQELIGRWRMINAVLGLVAAAAVAAIYFLPESEYLILLPALLLAYSLVAWVLYIIFHRRALAFELAAVEGSQTRIMSARPSSYGALVPYWWEVLPLAIVVLTALVLATRYSSAPAIIPIHFNLAGQADGFAAKSVASFFGLVWAQLGAWVSLTVLAVVMSMGGMAPRSGAGGESYRRTRVQFLFATKTGIVISMSLAAILTTGAYQPGGPAGQIAALVFAVDVASFVGGLLLFARYGRGGRRTDPGDATRTELGDDGTPDQAWLGGLIYYNPDDPEIFVPKRFGFGYTFNFGRPAVWLILAGLMLIPLIPVILSLTAGH